MPLYLCADCGGTKTSVVITDSTGTIVGRSFGGPSNITYLAADDFIATIRDAVGHALKTAISPPSEQPVCLPVDGAPPFAAAWFGISGADSPAAISKVSGPLSALLGLPLGPNLTIANDTHLLSAPIRMHTDVNYAIAVIAGTGSIAVSFRKVDGRIELLGRAGGWGWLLGDEGSGFYVGREALRMILDAHDRSLATGVPQPPSVLKDRITALFDVEDVMEILTRVYIADPTSSSGAAAGNSVGLAHFSREKRISSLSPLIFEAAFRDNDVLALNVLQSAAAYLAGSISLLLGEASMPDRTVKAEETVISFGGSLVGVERYRQMIIDKLAARGYIFRHTVFIDDAAAVGAQGLASAFNS